MFVTRSTRLSFLLALSPLMGCSDYNFAGEKPSLGGGEGPSNPTVDTGETGTPGQPGDTGQESEDLCEPPVAEAETVPLLDNCAVEPGTGTFSPVLEWAQTAPGDTVSTPAVANLTDDNWDGRVDAADTPDIVVSNVYGQLWALSGDDGHVLWYTYFGYTVGTYPMSPAVGDLDNDGHPEVVISGTSSTRAFRGTDGSLMWSAEGYTGGVLGSCGAVAIHDLDADGQAEVVIGRNIFDGATGMVLGRGEHGDGTGHAWGAPISTVGDIDRDGTAEVVTGNALYRKDGTTIWANGEPDGYTALGQFDSDPMAEIVVSWLGNVRLQDDDGTVLWTRIGVAGTASGPPTVGDFDGDGAPEIGVAGEGQYLALDTDGTTLWFNLTNDYSSGYTGSSLFDFEGDGRAEVVYADENSVWVFDGTTGAVRLEEGRHSSATCAEYPVIADVDKDGHAEIVYTSSEYSDTEVGVRVIGDAANSWRPARTIWNQHAYWITNVNDDGSIPAMPTVNWDTLNNFRSAETNAGNGGALPDLSTRFDWVCGLECGEGRLIVHARVTNPGWADVVAPVALELWGEQGGTWTLLATESVLAVASGEAPLPVQFEVPIEPGEEYTNLRLNVDGGNGAGGINPGVIAECDETNNEREWNEDVCR